MIQSEEQLRKNRVKNSVESLWDLMDRMKTVNICIIGNLGEKKVTTSIFKDNNYCKFPKPGERVHTQMHEV